MKTNIIKYIIICVATFTCLQVDAQTTKEESSQSSSAILFGETQTQLREAKPQTSNLKPQTSSRFLSRWTDSLRIARQRIDSLGGTKLTNLETGALFMPLGFYYNVTNDVLTQRNASTLSPTLMNVYLNHPEFVAVSENTLRNTASNITTPKVVTTTPEIVEQVAPKAEETTIDVVEVEVTKPNFWTFTGDYMLQFLQNFVTDNWYKGGESSYSMLGGITMQANYNNKQKVKWDNKLELKLGYITSHGDTLHKYRASEDLIRLTSKLGLQATKHWYYTLQMIAWTQFTYGLKSNDAFIYSDFMSPFNLNVSVGMDYNVEWCNKKLTGTIHLAPLAGNFRYVDRLALAERYSLKANHHTMLDYGSEVTIDLTWKFSDMLTWKTRLYGYTTYSRAELEWENTFSMKFNKYISTNIFLYPRFDDSTSRDDSHGYWQFKEYASVGFAYSF